MIELKAELLKKQQQRLQEQQKQKQALQNRLNWKSERRDEREGPDGRGCNSSTSRSDVSADELRRSQQALEAKSRLYQKLERGGMLEADLSSAQREGLMVDFSEKGFNPATGEFEFEEEHDALDDERHDKNSCALKLAEVLERLKRKEYGENDWIEFEDEFGRLRVVQAKELQTLQAEWAEIQTLLSKDPSPSSLHYVGDAEVRNKGVGFFTFSRDESERTRQMNALRRLRNETVESRTRALLLKEQRRLQIEQRLANLKARKAKTDGI